MRDHLTLCVLKVRFNFRWHGHLQGYIFPSRGYESSQHYLMGKKLYYIYLDINIKEIILYLFLIERNSLSVDDNIYAPPWRLSTLVKELSAAARTMQSSSKELSTLVADRVYKKM